MANKSLPEKSLPFFFFFLFLDLNLKRKHHLKIIVIWGLLTFIIYRRRRNEMGKDR